MAAVQRELCIIWNIYNTLLLADILAFVLGTPCFGCASAHRCCSAADHRRQHTVVRGFQSEMLFIVKADDSFWFCSYIVVHFYFSDILLLFPAQVLYCLLSISLAHTCFIVLIFQLSQSRFFTHHLRRSLTKAVRL